MQRTLAGNILRSGYETASRLGRRYFTHLHPDQLGLEVIQDVAYMDDGAEEHLLDVYRPRHRSELLPAVLYIHGGSFRILSKETHWMMAQNYAVGGNVVFNINYSLAPENPFPAGLKDCAAALLWLMKNAADFGADPQRIILAGESAGANLSTALTLCSVQPFSSDWARQLFDARPAIQAVLPACGLHEVSGMDRFVPSFLPKGWFGRVNYISSSYLPHGADRVTDGALADPLRVLEGPVDFKRQLPPFFIFCGARDIILEDSQRLHQALLHRGVDSTFKVYPGVGHAFHALHWLGQTRQCWADQHGFLRGLANSVQPIGSD